MKNLLEIVPTHHLFFLIRKSGSRLYVGKNWKLEILLFCAIFLVFTFVGRKAEAAIIGKPPTNLGLVGYWSMNEGTGAYAGDASGNKNQGTLINGPTWVDGKRGKALSFDGSDDVVSVSNETNFDFERTSSFSFGGWFKINDFAEFSMLITKMSNAGGGDDYRGWDAYVNQTTGKVTVQLIGNYNLAGLQYIEVITDAGIASRQWTHIFITYDGSSVASGLKIYFNGISQAFTTNRDALVSTTMLNNYPVLIGDRTGGASNLRLTGNADEVRIYNRALGAGEITTLYNSGAAKFTALPSNLGLVGYWPFNDATSTNTAFPTRAGDFSGNGNNGILTNGPTWVDGKRGKALNFDGVNDYVNAGSAATIDNIWTNGGTASAWIYARSYGENSRGRIFDKASNNNPDSGWILFIANGGSQQSIVFDLDWSVDVGGAGIWCLATTTQPYPTMNKWMHIAVTYSSSASGNDPTFYVNGVQAPISAYTGCNNNGTGAYQTDAAQNLLIGTSVSGDRSFDGRIDDVRLYKRVLSAAEIQALYQADYAKVNASQNNQITNGLVGLWSFNGPDMSGTTAFDRSGQGNNGTLTNGPALAAGKIGQALSFDGGDDYVNAGSGTSIDDVFDNDGGGGTLSAWIRPRSIGEGGGSGRGGVIAAKNQADNTWGFEMRANNQIRFTYACTDLGGGGGNNAWASSNNTISYNAWQHVAVAYNNNSANNQPTIYINGAPASLTQILVADDSPCMSDAALALMIGSESGNFTFDGTIDEVRMYDRALTTAEIKRLYNMGR